MDSLVPLLVLFLVGGWALFIYFFGGLPGRIARQRQHPQADAITLCGWIGVFLVGIGWLVALIWAHTHKSTATNPSINGLFRRKEHENELHTASTTLSEDEIADILSKK